MLDVTDRRGQKSIVDILVQRLEAVKYNLWKIGQLTVCNETVRGKVYIIRFSETDTLLGELRRFITRNILSSRYPK